MSHGVSLHPLSPLELSLESSALVEASAGTGKTFAITTIFLRLLLERQIDVSKILVVTFTKAATAELRDRIRRRIRDALDFFRGAAVGDDETLASLFEPALAAGTVERDVRSLEQALQGFDEAAIFTIHAFCERMLLEHAFESGSPFDATLVTNVDLVCNEIVRDFVAQKFTSAPRIAVERFFENSWISALEGLAREALQRPDVPVLPARPGEVDLAGELARWQLAWDEIREGMRLSWNRDEILALLSDSDVLKQGEYKEPEIRILAPVEEALDSTAILGRRAVDYGLLKLSPDTLRKGTKKNRIGETPDHPFFDACGRFRAAAQRLVERLDDWALAIRHDLFAFAPAEMRRRNEESGTLAFDDLLQRLEVALGGPHAAGMVAAMHEKFRAVLIDEFQDTDPVQWRIFRKLSLDGGPPVFLIGDPKQAIYSFRGADVFTYRDARRAVGDAGFTLRRNWRSDPGLIRAVNAIFARTKVPFLFDWIGFGEAEPREGAVDSLVAPKGVDTAPFEILLVEGESLQRGEVDVVLPARIAGEVAAFLSSGVCIRTGAGEERQAGPGDAAVLCRTNRQAADVHAELRKLGVPSVLYGDASVFDSDEAQEVELALRAMAEPGDPAGLRAALATRLLGRSGEQIDRLQADETEWDMTVRSFLELSSVWERQGFVAAFRGLLDRDKIPARLLRREDGERRLTNVFHLGELLQTASVEALRGPLALVEWIYRMRSDTVARAEMASEATQLRLESDERRVRVTTIHQAKGLEFEFVWVPFLWTPTFEPTPGRIHGHDEEGRPFLDIGSGTGKRKEQALREEMAECLRLLYVALTRAKYRCSIVWGSFKNGGRSALGYALHAPRVLPGNGGIAAVAAAVGSRLESTERLHEDLDGLVEASGGNIAVRPLARAKGRRWQNRAKADSLRAARVARRSLDGPWRTSSFSRLASGSAPLSEPATEGRDHEDPSALVERSIDAATVHLREFPRGARAGGCLHAILEHVRFDAQPEEMEELTARTLAVHGIAAEWADVVTRAIIAVLETPLGGDVGGFRFRNLAPACRRSELGFLLASASEEAPVTPARLSGVLTEGPSNYYAPRLARLPFPPFAGFLRGFVDLVFEQEGRWYVVDWKSNFLGETVADYHPARLRQVMEDHHYTLQLHLYSLALHRHLAARLPGYDYERHFGGAYYIFLRGVSPEHPEGSGIFHERPTCKRIAELDDLFAGREEK